ncbi:hypothetical protein BDD12DRAFT_878371 [Trichophaea hybrida]|nr:hypothetical protein BDD12DRAFT_878371 [Trichophaea hybrida]
MSPFALSGSSANIANSRRVSSSVITSACGDLVSVVSLLDTGADANFVDFGFVVKNKLPLKKLLRPISLSKIDGTHSNEITHSCNFNIVVRENTYAVSAFVTTVAPANPVVLGLPFINEHIPDAVAALDRFCLGSRLLPSFSPSSPLAALASARAPAREPHPQTSVPALQSTAASVAMANDRSASTFDVPVPSPSVPDAPPSMPEQTEFRAYSGTLLYPDSPVPPCPSLLAFAATTISDPVEIFSAFSQPGDGGGEINYSAISAAVEAEYQ